MRLNATLCGNRLTLLKMANFRLFQAKSLLTTIFKVDENVENLMKMLKSCPRKHWGKFLLFPQCFQKTSNVDT